METSARGPRCSPDTAIPPANENAACRPGDGSPEDVRIRRIHHYPASPPDSAWRRNPPATLRFWDIAEQRASYGSNPAPIRNDERRDWWPDCTNDLPRNVSSARMLSSFEVLYRNSLRPKPLRRRRGKTRIHLLVWFGGWTMLAVRVTTVIGIVAGITAICFRLVPVNATTAGFTYV